MAKNNFVMNFHGSVGEHIDKVDHMTVNIGSDGTVTKDKGDNTSAKAVGQRLKELRKEQRLGKPEVATRAGIRPSTLTAIEEGRYNTGIRQITDIAYALGAQIAIIPGGRTHDGIEWIRDFI